MRGQNQLKNIKGKRILLRVDFNVPVVGGKVTDDFRIKKSLETIEFLQKKKAKVILISHIGDDTKETLKPVFNVLNKSIKSTFVSSPVFSKNTKDMISKMRDGEVILLENIRKNKGEKDNDIAFAKKLSAYGDIYINDAFSVSHRNHASIIGLPKYLPSYFGFQIQREIKSLSFAFNPKHPFLFILGGAKFETKLPLIKKYLNKADDLFIGGALANQFFKEFGYETGKSLVENTNFKLNTLAKNEKIILPVDLVVFQDKNHRNTKPAEVKKNENILSVGGETIKLLESKIKKAKFILWNGPLGKYGFDNATEKILKIIVKNKVFTIVGGGDTVKFVSKLKLENELGFVSTGGGASLTFLVKGTLPGIEAVKKNTR